MSDLKADRFGQSSNIPSRRNSPLGVVTNATETQDEFSAPVYQDPRAQGGINALSQSALGRDAYASDLANFYRGQMGGNQDLMFAENQIAANDVLANRDFGNRLAQIRSGGYRGSTSGDVINQGQFVSDFTAQQAANNAALRQGAYSTGADRRFIGAQGLQGLSAQQLASAATLLQALRGQQTNRAGTSFVDESRLTGAELQGIASFI